MENLRIILASASPRRHELLDLAGIKNIRTKALGSNNKVNCVLATLEGLKSMKTPEQYAALRGKTVGEILG